MGGWRGFIESVLPGLVFIVYFVVTRDIVLTSILFAGTALVASATHLLQYQSIFQAISGFFGTGTGTLRVFASGKGKNFYTFGLIISAFFFLGVLFAVLVRCSLVPIGVGTSRALLKGWWRFERSKPLTRGCVWLSWLRAGVFVFRLMIEVPLWQMGRVAQPGVAKLILGIPLFALAVWLNWLGLCPFGQLVSRGNRARGKAGE